MGAAYPSESNAADASDAAARLRLGCVSYLNAKPLIAGIERWAPAAEVYYDVPGRLLAHLVAGEVELALCPIIDYFQSPISLKLIPTGAIGCRGETLTVRLFSRVPLDQVTLVHGDADSHTSVMLLRVVFAEWYDRLVDVVRYTPPAAQHAPPAAEQPEAMLLIGDKVITAAPEPSAYLYTLDLGEAWRELTGLPFVFASWLARAETELGDWPAVLDRLRRRNAGDIDRIVNTYAPAHGWPIDTARQYLARTLCYEVNPEQRQAIERFGALAQRHGLIDHARPLEWVSIDPSFAERRF